MWSTPSLSSLPGPLWLGVVASDRVLSMGQRTKLWFQEFHVFAFKLHTYDKMNCLK